MTEELLKQALNTVDSYRSPLGFYHIFIKLLDIRSAEKADSFQKWVKDALAEKYEREFGGPLRWIWKKADLCHELEIEDFYILACPKCENTASGPCVDTKNYYPYFNYCPHCSQQLLPPK